MKKYFLLMILCSVQGVYTTCAEKYTVNDLYELYNNSEAGTIITQEIRADLPYYKNMMSEHVASLEQQHLMACQEGVKSAVVIAATAFVVIPNPFRAFKNICHAITCELRGPTKYYLTTKYDYIDIIMYDLKPLIFGSIAVPFAADYFKHARAYKKRISEQYEVGKKILVQLEKAQLEDGRAA